MTKKSIIERNNKRKILIDKYKNKRIQLKEKIAQTDNYLDNIKLNKTLQKLPRDSAEIRFKNRCWKTGRSKGYYRFFDLSRNTLKEFFNLGYLPGVIKASW